MEKKICILIDNTAKRKDYKKDIHEVSISTKILPDLSNNLVTNPKPFYYNLIDGSKYPALVKLLGSNVLHWSWVNSYDSIPSFIMISRCCPTWEINTFFDYMTRNKVNPKATFINKVHLVTGNALFLFPGKKDLTRKYFDKKIHKVAKLIVDEPRFKPRKVPKSTKERYKVALNYLDYLTREKYITLETAYILMSNQINLEYVQGGYMYFQTHLSHTHSEFHARFLNLTTGAKHHQEKIPKYMWNKNFKIPLLHNKELRKNSEKMKQQVKDKLGIHYVDPFE